MPQIKSTISPNAPAFKANAAAMGKLVADNLQCLRRGGVGEVDLNDLGLIVRIEGDGEAEELADVENPARA